MYNKNYDMIVIGAGPGGYVAAIRGAQLGLRVCIIERQHMGGICLNWGCIPTKALLRSGELLHLFRRAGDFGLKLQGIDFDLDAIVRRSRQIAKRLNSGVIHLLNKHKVTIIMGTATVRAADRVRVVIDNKIHHLSGNNIVLANGARARVLAGLEPDASLVWTYKTALLPPRMPKKLLVIGSGAIGIEFASFYNSLGADTTVIEMLDRILPFEDDEISAFAKKSFQNQGMKIIENAMVKRLHKGVDTVMVDIKVGKKIEKFVFDSVISAVGIVGNVENLGLEALGIAVKKNHVVTDAYCRTNVAGIYAIGDLAAPPWLAHKASHEGVMVAELIAGHKTQPILAASIASCTYCYPQIASVGYTEAAAKKKGYQIQIGRFPFIANGKALALGATEGLVKTIFDAHTGTLLGAHMIGAEVTELIQGYVIAQQLETTEAELMAAIFPHPTLSEMMHESVLDAYGRAIHI